MLEFMPDIVCPAHTEEYYPTRDQLEEFHQWALKLRDVMTQLIDQPDPNFGMDARWCHFYPYRLVVNGEGVVEFELRIRNHLFIPAQVDVELRVPEGIDFPDPERRVTIPPKKEIAVPFRLFSSGVEVPDRKVITADITVNGAHIGEYTEALVELRLPVSRYSQ
jgi:hypothetical protein